MTRFVMFRNLWYERNEIV